MDCDICRKNAADYIEEKLPDGERQSFEGHMGECAECSRYVNNLTYTLECLHEMGREKAPAEMMDRVRARIYSRFDTAEPAPDRKAFSPDLLLFIRAAAVLFIVFLIGFFWHLTVGQDEYTEYSMTQENIPKKSEKDLLQDKEGFTGKATEKLAKRGLDANEYKTKSKPAHSPMEMADRLDDEVEYKKESAANKADELPKQSAPDARREQENVREKKKFTPADKAKESKEAEVLMADIQKKRENTRNLGVNGIRPVADSKFRAEKPALKKQAGSSVRIPMKKQEEVRKHIAAVCAGTNVSGGAGAAAQWGEGYKELQRRARKTESEEPGAKDKAVVLRDAKNDARSSAANTVHKEEERAAVTQEAVVAKTEEADAAEEVEKAAEPVAEAKSGQKKKSEDAKDVGVAGRRKGGGGYTYTLEVTAQQYKQIREYLSTVEGVHYIASAGKERNRNEDAEIHAFTVKDKSDDDMKTKKVYSGDIKGEGGGAQYITIRFIIIGQPAEQPAAQEGKDQE